MVLDGLATLYRSMKAQGIGRCKFRYQLNNITFDCLYFTDLKPFELVMGCLGHNVVLFFDVTKGFQINPFIEDRDVYIALARALRSNGGGKHRLSIKEFLSEFNEHIPATANQTSPTTPQDVIKYYSDIEDEDKVFFCGWLDNNIQGHRVSEDNLRKTRLMLGWQTFEFAHRRNQSTRWTHEESKAIKPHIPN